MRKIFEFASTIIYLLSALSLGLMAVIIISWSCYNVINAIEIAINSKVDPEYVNDMFIMTMLKSVSSIIIAVAIVDMAKYMFEEEVFRNKELRKPREARETITKIMVIISIAVSMEGLVYIFKAGTKDIALLIYPTLLILTSVFVIVGLGIYQKLSFTVEKEYQKHTDKL